ncbi:phage tail sheath C-terminal domain-containing protein [Mycetohabitans endofungorum]|uniref:Tail sheath protein n=2 Tax=Mycetohabitans TaxID=2571159 RepID=A0A2P5K775_9BURK|nr:phage tail sheath C-terminal domain-containing protein [Mycetohabitans endofungorum]PPB81912.1 tail sheath protein [Mycetohabitans endofungorum]
MQAHSELGVSVTRTPIGPAAVSLPTAVPLFVGYTEKGALSSVCEVTSPDDFKAQLGGPGLSRVPPFALYDTVCHYFDQGGGRCYALSLGSQSTYRESGPLTLKKDLNKVPWEACWAQAPQATLLAVPDLVLMDGLDKDAVQRWVEAWEVLVSAPAREARAFVLLDGPDDPGQVRQCLDKFAKLDLGDALTHAALYWPRLRTNRSSSTGDELIVPSSGAVAAVIQRTDRERGIWSAPANVALARVVGPTCHAMPMASFDGITLNRIRSFAARGVRVWGCRTLAPVSANNVQSPWQYVQLRRTMSYVEQHLSDLARFAVFEPNNAVTWLKLKSVARAWLRRLWLAGGLFGTQESDAFWLKIGLHESMTADEANTGLMRLNVGLALQYPAEFIELQLQIHTGESTVSSSVQAVPHRSALDLNSKKA